jgi:hypothetical protein
LLFFFSDSCVVNAYALRQLLDHYHSEINLLECIEIQ